MQLNRATKLDLYGHYAKVLVDLDVKSNLTSTIPLEQENYGFAVDIVYENLPRDCKRCTFLGHEIVNCQKIKSESNSIHVYCQPTNVNFPRQNKH